MQAALDSAVRVVPVRLSAASMLVAADLLPAFAALANRKAITLTDAHWNAGVAHLLAVLPARLVGASLFAENLRIEVGAPRCETRNTQSMGNASRAVTRS